MTMHLVVNLVLLAAGVWIGRDRRVWIPVAVLPVLGAAVALPLRMTTTGIFAAATGASWALFLHLPVHLWWRGWRAPAVALVLAAVWGFGVEPRRLEVNELVLPGPALRIALVADLQTDRVDAHTREALAAVAAARPDLVLFAGDYVQLPPGADHDREVRALNDTLGVLRPPLGAIAVRGDIDGDDWPDVFAGRDVRVVRTTTTLRLGDVTVTALSPQDSRSPAPPIPRVDGFHVVFGHAPDFVLANPPGDLFLAGHTHGGQVRIPGFGPLLTFSKVPRAMAAGRTDLGGGRVLYVSRGIGMERLDAPRVRFLCPPEVVVVQVGPEEGVAVAPVATGREG